MQDTFRPSPCFREPGSGHVENHLSSIHPLEIGHYTVWH